MGGKQPLLALQHPCETCTALSTFTDYEIDTRVQQNAQSMVLTEEEPTSALASSHLFSCQIYVVKGSGTYLCGWPILAIPLFRFSLV